MTIAEMFKKVETYNEMSKLLGVRFGSEAKLVMVDRSVVNTYYQAEDFKGFKKLIKEEYINCCAEKILNCKDYEFNAPITFETVDSFGSTLSMEIEFYVTED